MINSRTPGHSGTNPKRGNVAITLCRIIAKRGKFVTDRGWRLAGAISTGLLALVALLMIFSSLHNTLTPPPGKPIQYSTPTIHYNYIYRDHPTAMYPGHFDEVLAVAWSPDGTRIVSGSYDGTVQIWNTDGGKVVYTLRNGGLFVAWSPDGSQIASGGKDGIEKIWYAV